MKKLLSLFVVTVIAVLFTGCPQNTTKPEYGKKPQENVSKTQLKITNQSSRHLTLVDYESISFSTDVFRLVKCLPIGNSCVKDFTEESNSFIRFTVYSKEYSTESGWVGKKYDVRTSELIATESGKTKLFTVTDNTLVIINGTNTPVTLSSLYEDSTTVSIKNETSRMLKEVKFAEKIFTQENGEFNKGAAVLQSFTNPCDGYVYFTVHERDHHVANDKADTEHGENYSCTVYKVRTLEKFYVKKYEAKEIVIDDTTKVVKIGETDDKSIAVSALLKNDTLLKIENGTTRLLIRVKYGHTDFTTNSYDDNRYLPINKYKIQTFDETNVEEHITFTLPAQFSAGYVGVTVRTAEKIPLKKGMSHTVTLTDSTMVVKDGENTPVVLSSLYYYKTQFTLTNASSRDVFSTGGALTLEKGSSKTTDIGYYGHTYNEPLKFVLYARSSNSGTAFTVRTKDSIELNSGGAAQSFTIDDNTMVIIEGTEAAVTIASLLDNRPAGTLTVQNNSSRPLYSISFLSFPSFDLKIGENRIFTIETDNDAAPITVKTMYAKNEETVPYDSSVGVIQYTFKTDETICTTLGEATSFTFTDSTQIIPAGTFTAVPLSSLLDSSPYGYLTIENNYSKGFEYVTWNEETYENPNSYYEYWFPPLRKYTIRIGGTDTVSSYISFYVGYQDDAPKYRTGDPVSVPAGTAVTYSISGSTMVVKLPGTAPPAPLSTLEN